MAKQVKMAKQAKYLARNRPSQVCVSALSPFSPFLTVTFSRFFAPKIDLSGFRLLFHFFRIFGLFKFQVF
jgi:hypothetical protein